MADEDAQPAPPLALAPAATDADARPRKPKKSQPNVREGTLDYSKWEGLSDDDDAELD